MRVSERNFINAIFIVLAIIFVGVFCEEAQARPDFDVHPRTIEVMLNERFATRDTLRIDNYEVHGEAENLEWSVTIDPEDQEWLTLSVAEGTVVPGRNQRVVVTMRGSNAPDDHNYLTLNFHTNDPTREEYTVPVVGHKVAYPRITTGWIDEWGEWWGIDLNRIFGVITYGDTCSINLNIHNPGGANLVVDEIHTDNGYWEIVPDAFELEANAVQQVAFVFYAREVGANAATISSISNAWDPNELDFRIIAGVEPVFILDRPIPDIEMDEDSGELLIADLDTVFFSSDRGLEYSFTSQGLRSRAERNGELFISPMPNWNGQTIAIVSATNAADSTLIDTFRVTVNAIPDPPTAFDLISPNDSDTLRWDSPDTMFVWQESTDPDGDTVSYTLTLGTPEGDDPVVIENIESPECPISVLNQLLDTSVGNEFYWTVSATDGENIREAWSVFTNYVVSTSVDDAVSDQPTGFSLMDVYPNPFNSAVQIKFQIPEAGEGIIKISDSNGRVIDTIFSGLFSNGRQEFSWNPENMPSGTYIVLIDFNGKEIRQPVLYLK